MQLYSNTCNCDLVHFHAVFSFVSHKTCSNNTDIAVVVEVELSLFVVAVVLLSTDTRLGAARHPEDLYPYSASHNLRPMQTFDAHIQEEVCHLWSKVRCKDVHGMWCIRLLCRRQKFASRHRLEFNF